MTSYAMTPYNGATRKGVEHIQATLREASAKSRVALEASITENDEVLDDAFHPSERALQASWEKNIDRHKRELRDDRDDRDEILFGGAATIGIPSLVGFLSLVAFSDKTLSNPSFWGFAFAALGAAFFCAFSIHYTKFLVKYLRERSLGFTTRFVYWNRLRMSMAWAITDKAVYVVNRDNNSETLTVCRIAFDDVQACAFRDMEGTPFVDLYNKAGKAFTLLDPTGERTAGAAKLASLISFKMRK
jgi:hypothetical protein